MDSLLCVEFPRLFRIVVTKDSIISQFWFDSVDAGK